MANFLVIGPHPDDQELGMGGTIAKLKKQGHAVHLIDMTNGEPTPRGTPELRAAEAAKAARLLGVERTLLGLPNRQVQHSIEARYKLAALIRVHKPNVLFVPYPIDAHPDHTAVTRIAEDARFDAKLSKSTIPGDPWHPKRVIYYFCTHLRLNINPTFCIDVSDTADQKMAALAAYESQMNPDLLRQVQVGGDYFGTRIGTRHAEPFYSHEVMGFTGLDQLV
ncbi:MAG: bacillithiol biosynthesis deacetylase BshB1 [Burkholderiales bacterium]|nr:bacillithiol biosynthesis deacetylase BshB1 [Phycisphaerae bacterium]